MKSNHSEKYEVIFHKDGGATLQNHSGSFATFYEGTDGIVSAVRRIYEEGHDPSRDSAERNDPSLFVSDDTFFSAEAKGLFYALQLDLHCACGWPSPEDIQDELQGWDHVAEFINAIQGASKE